MSLENFQIEGVDFIELAQHLGKNDNLWQLELLSPREFADYCSERSLNITDQAVWTLWKIGLLRADIISCSSRNRRKGLIYIRKDEDNQYIYRWQKNISYP